MERRCNKCSLVKPLTDFYPHPTCRGGYDVKRKACKIRHCNIYNHTPRGRLVRKKAARNFIRRHPNQVHAKWLVARALKVGRLLRLPCEICGARAQAHHIDYSKPLAVRWLCRTHHLDTHVKDRRRYGI
jgi:hypothetical protein